MASSIPSQRVPFVPHEESLVTALKQTLSTSGKSASIELHQTALQFDQLVEATKAMAVTLFTENEQLRQALTKIQSQKQQMITVLQQELEASQQEATIAQQETKMLRKKMTEMASRTDDLLAKTLTSQKDLLKATKEGLEARITSLQEQLVAKKQEVETMRQELTRQAEAAEVKNKADVLAATQAGAAQVASVRLEAERTKTSLENTIYQLNLKIHDLETTNKSLRTGMAPIKKCLSDVHYRAMWAYAPGAGGQSAMLEFSAFINRYIS